MGNTPAYTGPPAPTVGPSRFPAYDAAGKPLRPIKTNPPPVYRPLPPAGAGYTRPAVPMYQPRSQYSQPMAPSYIAPAASTAYALDAADGVLDGRYYGGQIAVRAPTYAAAPTYLPPASTYPRPAAYPSAYPGAYPPAYPAAYPPAYAASYPAPYPQAYPAAYSPYGAAPTYNIPGAYTNYGSPAQALDAADGRMDGRYFGAPIVQTHAAPAAGSAAGALDAADGRMDGRYFGAPIVQSSTPMQGATSAAGALDAADGRMDGSYYGAPIAQSSQAAGAMDAADGRLDGRYFGAPIVQPAYAPQQSAYAPHQAAYAPQQSAYAPHQAAYAPQQFAHAPQQFAQMR